MQKGCDGVAGAIIWYVTMFGCAVLFFLIGVYAGRMEKPMWFWSGSKVDAATITDVRAYNRENASMWKWYSAWYWIAGLAWVWSKAAALIVLVLGCSVGILVLVRTYQKIEKKYERTGL